ncbi:alpha/beta hydrolase [Leptolyngbya sp. FACHB-261]|uniref:alpha/beta hydrolase n=1 Tax=Leptolyngbya sp. FACHB-261 TaxID=2692806 RepID=UPI001685F6E3|nr:alpha/beta hydrolase [Leptolyngbya sp. FACHB-261]MBD2102874.1 alpha/beta hydrolase [Leptolyngbya sp. FACHB-261]
MQLISHTDIPLFDLYKFRARSDQTIPGYLALSTAPVNVDATQVYPALPDAAIFEIAEDQPKAEAETQIQQIARHLWKDETPELVIAIHGYSSRFSDVQAWYKSIYDYINNDVNIDKSKGRVFIGYRWPSENPAGDASSPFSRNLSNAVKALPSLPSGMLWGRLVGSALTLIAFLVLKPFLLLVIPLLLFVTGFSLILMLVVLRLVTYFRDSYRAANFGVPDLVELIRQLDQAVFEQSKLTEEQWKIQPDPGSQDRKRLKLTFIGHSMGCFVVTNAIRILSDVFDTRSIGNLSIVNPDKSPSSAIGRVFSLGRLVLVAPDIPVETIMPRRANFLRSSLRRFEEAYIFSNEGDLALRLASTTANYFSFPAMNRTSGYRLGNITVKHFVNQQQRSGSKPFYGIVNPRLADGNFEDPYQYLEVRASKREHKALREIRSASGSKPVANLFTYFDCTDYRELTQNSAKQGHSTGVVSYALGKPVLQLWDYIALSVAFFALNLDVHGGYFRGQFSQQAIYQLAFLGFQEFLNALTGSDQTPEQQLQVLSEACQQKGIQVVLAPERYQVDLLGQKRDRSGY